MQPTSLTDAPPLDVSWFHFATRTMIFVVFEWPGFVYAQPATDTDSGEAWTFTPPPGSGWLPASGVTTQA